MGEELSELDEAPILALLAGGSDGVGLGVGGEGVCDALIAGEVGDVDGFDTDCGSDVVVLESVAMVVCMAGDEEEEATFATLVAGELDALTIPPCV